MHRISVCLCRCFSVSHGVVNVILANRTYTTAITALHTNKLLYWLHIKLYRAMYTHVCVWRTLIYIRAHSMCSVCLCIVFDAGNIEEAINMQVCRPCIYRHRQVAYRLGGGEGGSIVAFG